MLASSLQTVINVEIITLEARWLWKRHIVINRRIEVLFKNSVPLLSLDISLVLWSDMGKNSNDCLKTLWLQILELTEKYCRERDIPFPQIIFNKEDEESPKECYMFMDAENPKAPIVLHFPLVNDTFRKYKMPGMNSLNF